MANTPYDILERYSNDIVSALIESLQKHGRYGSGTFAQSIIAMPIKVMGNKLVMEIQMDEFWKFIDEGVDGWGNSVGSPYSYKKGGKPIPMDAMKRFISRAGISPAMNIKRGRLASKIKNKQLKKAVTKDNAKKDLENTAWAIGYSIKKKGLKRTKFATEVFESDLIEDMEKELSRSIGRLITLEIKKDLKNGNNNT